MNPYLKARIERYEKLRASVDEIQTRAADESRDLTDDELRSIQGHGQDAQALYDELAPEIEAETRSRRVAELAASVTDPEHVRTGAGGGQEVDPFAALGGGLVVPALVPSREQVAELYRAAQGQGQMRITVDAGAVQHRAAVTTAKTGTPVAMDGTLVLREPRRLSVAAGLSVQHVAGVEGVAFPVFGAGTAGIAAEGATKPEYANVTPGSATPQMISVWTDASRQVLTSVTSFDSRLRRKHAALVAKQEDLLLVSTVQATAERQTLASTSGWSKADSLLAAAALVLSSDVSAEPNLAVINPADVPSIFGGAVGRAGESPESELRLDLHGMTVYVTPAIAAGKGLVGAWQAAARFIVGMAPTVLIDAASGLKKNMVTTLTEEAVALAVDEPTGFVEVTFATS